MRKEWAQALAIYKSVLASTAANDELPLFKNANTAPPAKATPDLDALRDAYEALLEELAEAGFVNPSTQRSRPSRTGKRTLSELRDYTSKVGPAACASLLDYLESDVGREVAERLAALGIHPASDNYAPAAAAPVGSLVGKTFVITGTLSRPRQEFVKLIESAGGKVASSVSKKTSYVLAGAEAGSKLEIARELDVPVLSEAAFFALLDAQASPGADN
jgi:DNA ligase (NAD+)